MIIEQSLFIRIEECQRKYSQNRINSNVGFIADPQGTFLHQSH